MKTKLLIIALVLYCIGSFSQGVYNNGVKIFIQSGAVVYITGNDGNYRNETQNSSDGTIILDGTIKLTKDWINNAIASDVLVSVGSHKNGTVVFNGTGTISGSSTTGFNNVTISGSSSLIGHSTNMNVAGNWTNNGTFIHNNGKVTFNNANINFPSQYSGLSVTTFNDVDVAAGSSLKVLIGKTMTIDGKLKIKATDSNHMAQLVLEDNSTHVTGVHVTDSVFVELYDTLNNWHYLSAPVFNGRLGASVFYNYYGMRFDETQNIYTHITGFDSLQASRGYAIKFNPSMLDDSKRVITFSAPITQLHTGTITYPITYTNGKGDGWNMVGNPYPCAIDVEATAGWNWSTLESCIYTYDAVNSRYAYYIRGSSPISDNGGSRYIPPMQGFYVHCKSAGQWSMDNRVRVANNQSLWKGDIEDNNTNLNRLSIIATGNGFSDESVIAFQSDATKGFDDNLDAYKLLSPEGKIPQINTKTLDDNPIRTAINCLPTTLMKESSVPLEFTVGVTGTYTITAASLGSIDPSIAVTLEDLKTNKMTDLRTSAYSFSSDSVTNDSRFLVHFGPVPTSVNEKNVVNNINIYSDHNQIVIQNNSSLMAKGTVIVYDVLGKEIVSENLEPNAVTRIDMADNYAQAIYIVKVLTNDQTLTKKVCVNK